LLPDSYNLRAQTRNGPAINPATVEAPATRMLARPALYDFAALNRHGLVVHAPGEIAAIQERLDGVGFTVRGWSASPFWILINGFAKTPTVRINGKAVALVAPHFYQAAAGRLVLQLDGTATIDLGVPALAAVGIAPVAPRQVKVTWPVRATNGVLEASAGVAGPDAAWVALGPPTYGDSTAWAIIESNAFDRRFYRLRLAR
jgi:hypothetical protein